MVSEYITKDEYNKVRRLLTAENRLALDLSIKTGLRIGDIVALPAEALGADNRLTYTAAKTDKTDTVKVDKRLAERLRRNADNRWLFPAKVGNNHRTRQAVWKNLRDCCERLGLQAHITPHSARKAFAVELLHSKGLKAVQRALQHDNTGTTMLYAYSDITRAATPAQGARAAARGEASTRVILPAEPSQAPQPNAPAATELLQKAVQLLRQIRDELLKR